MSHTNLTAYEGVENLASFSDEEFREYCDGKIADCDRHVRFLKKIVSPYGYEGKVLEIGSGNGKLLYALESNGLLSSGFGYELSGSRVGFADKFAEYVGSTHVKNIQGDFLEYQHDEACFDLVVGVDIVLQLIAPVSENAEMETLKECFSILKPGGALVLELLDFTNTIEMISLSGGELKLWKEFDSHDPWQFGLDTFEYKDRNIIWDKRFINRNRSVEDSYFKNVLRQYDFETVKEKLCEAGFSADGIERYSYWHEQGDIPENEFIVTAVKQ